MNDFEKPGDEEDLRIQEALKRLNSVDGLEDSVGISELIHKKEDQEELKNETEGAQGIEKLLSGVKAREAVGKLLSDGKDFLDQGLEKLKTTWEKRKDLSPKQKSFLYGGAFSAIALLTLVLALNGGLDSAKNISSDTRAEISNKLNPGTPPDIEGNSTQERLVPRSRPIEIFEKEKKAFLYELQNYLGKQPIFSLAVKGFVDGELVSIPISIIDRSASSSAEKSPEVNIIIEVSKGVPVSIPGEISGTDGFEGDFPSSIIAKGGNPNQKDLIKDIFSGDYGSDIVLRVEDAFSEEIGESSKRGLTNPNLGIN